MTDLRLRPVTLDDAAEIARIYEHYVRTHPATFELEPPGVEEMRRRIRKIVDAGYPYWVAELGAVEGEAAHRLAGFCYAAEYRDRPAYRATVENSIYVDHTAARRGIGRALLQQVIEECGRLGYREMIAVIGDSANEASIALHRELGFRRVGVFTQVGYKLGRWLDTVLMQRTL